MNNLKENKNRDIIFDIAKDIGIILVVYGHAIEIYKTGFVFRFIYLFHMAFFFIVSGYFFKEKYLHEAKTFIKKRFNSLIIPYLGFNIIFLFLHNFWLDIGFLPSNYEFFNMLDTKIPLDSTIDYYSIKTFITHFIWILLLGKEEFFVGTTWFLKVLFFISCGYLTGLYWIKKLNCSDKSKNIYEGLLCGIFLLMGFLCYKIDFSFYRIGTMFSCVFLFYLGVLTRRLNINKIINNRAALPISFIMLTIINVLNTKFFYISRNYYNNPIYLILAAVFGYIFLMSISNWLKNIKYVTNILSYIGKHTISILCLHLVFFKITILIQILIWHKPIEMLQAYETYYTSYCWGFIYTSISVIFCLFVLKLYNYLIQLKKKILFNKHN